MHGTLPRRPLFGGLLDPDGVVIALVPDSAAERAGVRVGDRIVELAGAPVGGADALVAAQRRLAPGDAVSVALLRGGERRACTVVVTPCPPERVPGARVHHGEVQVDGVRQRTIVVSPVERPRAPVVVFLQGITIESVEIVPPRPSPIASWVAALAAAGLATCRIDRRGVGDSEGDAAVDLATERAGYLAAIAALRAGELGPVDPDAIVLFGHSTGGMLAPQLAHGCRGIVVYGTWAARFTDAMIASMQRQRPGSASNDLDAALLRAVIDDGRDVDDVIASSPALAGASALDVAGRIYGRTPAYLRQLADADLTAAWRRAGVRTRLLHGAHDRVTTSAQHLEIAELLAAEGVAAEVRELAGFDHAMEGEGDAIAEETVAFVRAVVGVGASPDRTW